MSGTRRERGSKWELEPDISPGKCHESGWSSRAGSSFHEHESRKYLPGRRGYHKTENVSEESREPWEGDGRYDTNRVSPAIDGWRRRNHSRSPRSSRGRSHRSNSRSRSPPRNPRKEPGFDEGNSCTGSAEVCKDFAAGSCRKGDLCHFSHHGSPVRDRRKFDRGNGEGWESRHGGGLLRRSSPEYHSNSRRSAPVCNSFLAGRCRKGSSCNYVHDSKSNEYGKELLEDVYKDRHVDWRGREGRSCDRYREPHKVSETMCRFFLAGHCRDGKHCRYSHHQEDPGNLERRLLGERRSDQNSINMDELRDHSKWSTYKSSPRNGSEARMWEEDRSKMMDSMRPTDVKWSNRNYMDQDLAGRNHLSHGASPSSGGDDKSTWSSKEQSLHWKGDASAGIIAETKRGENCYTERAVPSPNSIFKPQTGMSAEKCDSVPPPRITFSPTDQDMGQGTSSGTHYGGGFMQHNRSDAINSSFGNAISTGTGINSTPYSNFNVSSFLPGQGALAQLTSSLNALAQGQTYQLHPKAGDDMQLSHDHPPVDAKTNGAPFALREDTREKLAQLSQFSLTLAHLREKGSSIALPSATTGGPSNQSLDSVVAPAPIPVSSASQLDQASGPMTLDGPVSDSLDSKLLQSGEHINSGIGASQVPFSSTIPTLLASSAQSGASDNILGQKNLTEGGTVTVVEVEDNGREEKNEELENGIHDDTNVEGGGGDDEKKGKDSKVVRAFKFSLAEFVKELLKPTWKDGQVSKEVYKTIVKKVVDKVSDSIQPAQVPRTKEKINLYLSSSKPKLSKLVQAYLEKYQKT